ncbi:MAG: peptidyl-prolyl cis-trans isomerase [Lachnospiraceae bacterium]|nr:peptidyl-prolyl cis-trans isomerase [Lachnospiraceae bacterium]
MCKKLASVVLALSLVFTCVACGDTKSSNKNSKKSKSSAEVSVEDAKNTEVLKIGDEKITLDYMYLYVIQFIYTYSATEDTIASNMDSYKSQIISQLRTDEIKYIYAKNNGIELTDDEKKEMDDVVDRYYKTFPEKFLEQYGISRDTVESLFFKQRYISKLNDETQKKLEEQYQKEAAEELKDKTFFDLYYMLFPTVEYKDGSPVTDSDGNYTQLSDEKKQKQAKDAEEAKKRLEAGEDIQDLEKEYGIEECSEELRSYFGAYSEDLNNLIKDLQNGDVSETYESDLGYMVVKMVNNNDEDYKQYYIETAAGQKASNQMTVEENNWLASVEVDEEKDMIGDTWNNLDISKIAAAMDKEGIAKSSK